MTHFAEAKYMKGQYTKHIMEMPNVVGVGIGYKESSGKMLDELCIIVLVRKKLPIEALPSSGIIPHELEGVKTDVVEVGDKGPGCNGRVDVQPFQDKGDYRPHDPRYGDGHKQ